MKALLLDTNAVSAFFKGDSHVLNGLAEADHVWISTIVLGELYAGFRSGDQFSRNMGELKKLLACSTVDVLPVTSETADYYGRLYLALRKQGMPIPTNDLWIAAQTLEQGAVLFTFDKHFAAIPGLRVG
jgi:tRNA(fMet)-specific endonuclease VapC